MIAVVEDDSSIRELLCYTLNNTNFEAQGFEDGRQFFEFLENNIPKLILLDIMLPQEDGIEILRKIRGNRRTAKIPVIMLTAKGTEYDKIIGLDAGADDYVSKPFGVMELISRIKAVLRRYGVENEIEKYSYKNLIMDDVAHVVTAEAITIDLTFKEYQMLKILLKNIGKVLTRDNLLQQIWGYDFDGETRTVDVHIRTLRTKLLSCGEYIETVRGVGYKISDNQ